MAVTKDIVLLDIREIVPGAVTLRFAIWLQVTNGFPNSGLGSAYPAINTDPNTAGILVAIQNGTVIEEVFIITVPVNWVATQWTAIEALMLGILNGRKAAHAGTLAATPDPGLKYAILHDSGTGWSA